MGFSHMAYRARILVIALVVVGCVAGCSKKPPRASIFDPQGWLIESYDNGVITVQHEGNTYKATCDSSRSFNNATSITDPNNVHEFHECDLAIELVGRNVQPFEGKQKDGDGRIINMWNVGSSLALRSWLDEHTPWRQEEFRITLATKNLEAGKKEFSTMWLALGLNVLGGILAGLVFPGYAWLRLKFSARQFKQVFGPGVASPNFALIYAELELGDRSQPFPYSKPGGNPGAGFSIARPVSSCEVRALNYLASTIGRFVGATPSLRSDLETRGQLNLDLVSLGGPESNLKTADCQSNSANRLAVFDQPKSQFTNLTTGSPLVTFERGFDYGLILKVRPSQFPERVWFITAGIGEWGTSGAGWFLANKWQQIGRQAGGRAFAAVVRVRPGQDESAEIRGWVVAPTR